MYFCALVLDTAIWSIFTRGQGHGFCDDISKALLIESIERRGSTIALPLLWTIMYYSKIGTLKIFSAKDDHQMWA